MAKEKKCTWSKMYHGIMWFLGLNLSGEEKAHWECVKVDLGCKKPKPEPEPEVDSDGPGEGRPTAPAIKKTFETFDKRALLRAAKYRSVQTSYAEADGTGGTDEVKGAEPLEESTAASGEADDRGLVVKHNMVALLLNYLICKCKMDPGKREEELSEIDDILNCRCLNKGQDEQDSSETARKKKHFDIYWIERILNLQYRSEIFVDDGSLYMHEVTQKRPYFTIWLMLVHIIVMVTTVAVYDFAPYQWGVTTQEAFVQRSSLALEVAKKNMTGSVWGGPDLESLVLLGAMYAPCMRRDRQLYTAIEAERKSEATHSGCCVRRDKSGCYQAPSSSNCPATYADFVYQYNDSVANTSVRGVCGTSPDTCIEPNKVLNPLWNSVSISNWPICSQAVSVSTPSYLSCELTGRPCCVGLQAKCLITTLEHCTFLGGHYHSEAFLCSQVDCLSAVCGLLPFIAKDEPDQWYRLGLSLHIHAGVLHLLLTLLFDLFVLWVIELKLGWLKTSFVYIFSGIGGNIFSAIFVPYYPQVGPGASIFGIIANIFVFVLSEWPYWKKWRRALPVLSCFLLIFFVLGFLLPFLDNFAHFGGLMFGIFLSWIVLPMKPIDESCNNHHKLDDKYNEDFLNFYTKRNLCKRAMTVVSMVISLVLFIICFTWFYAGQDNWYGFIYLNCVPYTSSFCLNYGLDLESRNLY